MAVRIRLSDAIHLVVDAELDEFTKAYQQALKENGLLEVENGNGRMRVLNPQQILYFEDAAEPIAEDDVSGAPASAGAPKVPS